METLRICVADGVELAADTWAPAGEPGPGGPVPFVLVHGLASNARMWDGVATRLTRGGHPAVSVDLRGHGRSSRLDGPFDVPVVAHDVARLIDGLALERPVVVGQSWGGNVVLELAARRPEAVRGIVCVDGGWLELGASFDSWEACREALAPPRLAGVHRDDIERYIRDAHPDWPETGIAGALANFETRRDGTVAPWLTYDRHIAVLRGLWDHHPSERYASVPVPVLLVPADGGEGAHDDRLGRKRDEVRLALALLPNARARWMRGDHDIHAQHPDELADLMTDQVAGGFLA